MKKLAIFLLLNLTLSASAYALDINTYRQVANDTVRQMNMGIVGDIDAMIVKQEQLMILGIEGGVSFLKENPDGGQPLQHVILNAEGMKGLSLTQIEALWHGGEYLRSKGIDPDKIDHFGPMMSLMDTVIHPATSYLLLKEYKRTGNSDLLVRVKAELLEVLEHINHIQPSHGVQLSSN